MSSNKIVIIDLFQWHSHAHNSCHAPYAAHCPELPFERHYGSSWLMTYGRNPYRFQRPLIVPLSRASSGASRDYGTVYVQKGIVVVGECAVLLITGLHISALSRPSADFTHRVLHTVDGAAENCLTVDLRFARPDWNNMARLTWHAKYPNPLQMYGWVICFEANCKFKFKFYIASCTNT